MEKLSPKRQLAAIMFTDIVGYTALMGESEEKALHTRRINREIHQQKIEAAGGTWLKEMGDGTLASFNTITDAVKVAIEIRKICKQELDIELKVGIHSGEVIYEDNDVFGDGVNIASRIQELATGGGILISEAVFNEIKNKDNLKAAFIGETLLKNVDGQIKIYQVLDRDLDKPNIKIKKSGLQKRLVSVAAIYIIASLIVMQVISLVFPLIDLATFHQRWLLLLISLGLPITLLFVWANQFDFNAALFKRNKTIAWSGSLAFTILGLLLGFNLLGGAMTYTVEIEDVAGNITEHQVLNARFIPRVHVFPFQNKQNNKKLDWVAKGLQVGIIDDLLQFSYVATHRELLRVYQHEEEINKSFTEKVERTTATGSKYFIDGEFEYEDEILEVSMRIFDISAQEDIMKQSYRFNSVIDAGDSLSLIVRNWLNIDPVVMRKELDFPLKEYLTDTDSALKYYVLGDFLTALKLDSSFAIAALEYTFTIFRQQFSKDNQIKYVGLAMAERDRLPKVFMSRVLSLHYAIEGNPENALKVLNNQIILQPNNVYLMEVMMYLQQIWESDDYLKTLDVIGSKRPLSDLEVMNSLIYLCSKSNYDLAIKKALKYKVEHPGSRGWDITIGTVYLAAQQYDLARQYFEGHSLETPEDKYILKMIASVNYYESNNLDHVGKLLNSIEGQFTMLYNNELVLHYHKTDYFITRKRTNGRPDFYFLINDSTIINYYMHSRSGQFTEVQLLKNKDGKNYAFKVEQYYFTDFTTIDDPYKGIDWRVDSVFSAAREALVEMDYPKAKALFLDVYARYPEFYFVKQYLDHINFITSVDFPGDRLNLNDIIGDYGEDKIWQENNQFKLQIVEGGPESLLVHISSNILKIVGNDYLLIEIVRNRNGTVKGIQYLRYNPETMKYEKVRRWFFAKYR